MNGTLKRDVTVNCWPLLCGDRYRTTFPKGTIVRRIGAQWAIASVALIAKLTGNQHDARYRYVWVDTDDVEVTP